METPLISIIIPAHNNSSTIRTAIDSIRNQTYSNLEIVVVDDHSTDTTEAIVSGIAREDRRISYYKLPYDDPHRFNKRGRNINAGYSARNYGFEKIHGEWVTFQDADDASLVNRIEVQYGLATKYNATHLCVDWQKFDTALLGKKFDANRFLKENPKYIIKPEEMLVLAKKIKGPLIPLLGPINTFIPFEWKRFRLINKLFFGALDPYPGTGNSPLFRRNVLQKVRFRPLPKRIWPSFTGRGADRDFNFQVAETFKNSYVFFIPLYMWRVTEQNERYSRKNLYNFML